MAKIRVAVLMGGVSAEYDISVKSGTLVAENLDADRFAVTSILVQKSGMWQPKGGPPMKLHNAAAYLDTHKMDCVFIALHGPYGEDGRVQGLLDLLGIPYVGSGCAASALAMDKVRSKAIMRDGGIAVGKDVVVTRSAYASNVQEIIGQVSETVGFPCVAKCPSQGSSLGMAIVADAKGLEEALPALFEVEDVVLVEEFLAGREVTCAVLQAAEDDAPRALPVTEILPKSSAFFDYEAKYTVGASDEITPADLPEDLTAAIQAMALRAHELVGCRGFSRSDMILVENKPIWLEINTIPGLTETSLFPQAAKADGISFQDLLGMLVDGAIRTKENS